MHKVPRSPIFALLLALMLSFGSMLPAGAATIVQSDRRVSQPAYTSEYAMVQLKGAPLSTYYKTKPAPGKKIDFNSTAVKSYRAQLSARRNEFKQWLQTNAPKAVVARGFDVALNGVSVKLNGTSLATLRGSSLVQYAEYQGVFYRTAHADPDLALIKALQAWNEDGGPADAGEGVDVAIIDSGIDVTHPCFDDAGYPDVQERGDTRFTNDKVIVARVFNNRSKVLGLTPEATQDHGTHVAGTVACNYHTPAVVDGVDIPYDISGVAPRALLGNYNVFPGWVVSARSEDILNALETAYTDGMDVANMSLGGGYRGAQELVTHSVNNLDRANMVIAISQGNNGPGYFTGGSPGMAERAITAGASTVGHFVGTPVTVVGEGTWGAAAGDFNKVTANLTAPLGVVKDAAATSTGGLGTACTALPTGSLTGKIALISRGACDFSTKIYYAQAAGAVAALVVNNVAGDPTSMGQGVSPSGVQPTIPAYMLPLSARAALLDANGKSTTIDKDLQYFNTANDNIMAGFSAWGPTRVTYRIKPDLVAPGVNVLSSVAHREEMTAPGEPGADRDCGPTGCFAFFQGTSMASPHVAGAAAVLRAQHPNWAAWQVRSALINTANRNTLTSYLDGTTPVTDVQQEGAGLMDVLAATNAKVALDPTSVSFGGVPSISGQRKATAIRLTNISGGALSNLSVAVTNQTGKGVTYSATIASTSLAANGSTTITVRMTAAKGATRGLNQGYLVVKSGGTEIAHAAVFTLVK